MFPFICASNRSTPEASRVPSSRTFLSRKPVNSLLSWLFSRPFDPHAIRCAPLKSLEANACPVSPILQRSYGPLTGESKGGIETSTPTDNDFSRHLRRTVSAKRNYKHSL